MSEDGANWKEEFSNLCCIPTHKTVQGTEPAIIFYTNWKLIKVSSSKYKNKNIFNLFQINVNHTKNTYPKSINLFWN